MNSLSIFSKYKLMLILGSCSFAMNVVHIRQPYDTLHVDLFNSIKLKNENNYVSKKTDLTIF